MYIGPDSLNLDVMARVLATILDYKWKSFSRVWFFATPWTIQSMEFSRPEYWSG